MSRVVLLLLAWAAAGAIVNVAVAWGLWTVQVQPKGWTGRLTEAELDLFRRFGWTSQLNGRNGAWYRQELDQAWGMEWRECVEQDDGDVIGIGFSVQCGWPSFALTGAWLHPPLGAGSSNWLNLIPHGLIVTSTTGDPRAAYPISPLWPGFAINTLFYAAILWGLFAAPFVLRRRRRIKRGLCPKCAYDLRGRGRSPASDSSVCPECGTGALTASRSSFS